jgi:glycine cleavage system transcriptional repressor
MVQHFVIGVLGSDRPGIVDEVSRIVAEQGCNIEDSHMAHLGGEFGLMMLFSGEGDAPRRAGERIREWAEERDMSAVARPTSAGPGKTQAAAQIGVQMPDKPGIVSRVTHFLAERGANVETLRTELRRAPFTGTPTFSMHVDVSSAEDLPLEELRDALHDLADDEEVHITIGKSL